MDFWEGTFLESMSDQDAKVWLEDKDVLVLAKKNKQDPTQVQFPGDWLMVSSVIGAAVCLWIYTFNIYADIYHSGCDIFVPNVGSH